MTFTNEYGVITTEQVEFNWKDVSFPPLGEKIPLKQDYYKSSDIIFKSITNFLVDLLNISNEHSRISVKRIFDSSIFSVLTVSNLLILEVSLL